MATLQCFFARLGRSSTVCELCFLPTHQPTEAECANASLFADTVLNRTRLKGIRTHTDPTDTTGASVSDTLGWVYSNLGRIALLPHTSYMHSAHP